MRERTERFWSDFFGLAPDELCQPGVRVVPHRGLGDYAGAWIFWREETIFLSTPPDLVDEIRAAIPSTVSRLPEPQRLASVFATRAERWIGPAYQGYLERDRFRGSELPGVSPVDAEEGLLEALCVACDPEEWAHAGIEPQRPEPCFGVTCDQRLVAVAQNAFWSEGTVSPGLLVHPDYRGRGYGKAVLAAATADALRGGHLVLYQTLCGNVPAVRAASALGYAQFATHLAVRFRA